jgi:diguanylate cyclase (GGDEF)-like protein
MDSRDRLRSALGRIAKEDVIEPAIELILRPVIEKGSSHLIASAARLTGMKECGAVLTLRDWTGVRKEMDRMRERIEELSETLGKLGVEHVQLWETSEKLESLAIYDELTNLYNRRYFSLRGKEEFARALRHQEPLGLLMLDLDRFKQVNDEMGHLFGDAVLQQSGALIRQTVRMTDVAVRYGGEEFLVLAPETAGTGLEVLAERLRVAFEKHEYLYENRSRKVTVSVGGTSIPPYQYECMEHLVAEADKALYEAKADRNRAVCHQVNNA